MTLATVPIRKAPKEDRYTLTGKGRKFAAVLLTASAVEIKGLMNIAA